MSYSQRRPVSTSQDTSVFQPRHICPSARTHVSSSAPCVLQPGHNCVPKLKEKFGEDFSNQVSRTRQISNIFSQTFCIGLGQPGLCKKLGVFLSKVLPNWGNFFSVFFFCHYKPFTDLLATWSIFVFLALLQPCRHPSDQFLQV